MTIVISEVAESFLAFLGSSSWFSLETCSASFFCWALWSFLLRMEIFEGSSTRPRSCPYEGNAYVCIVCMDCIEVK